MCDFPQIPRICDVQTDGDNYPANTAHDYYRLKLTIPLLDHVIREIESHFPSEMCNLYNGFYVIPSNFLHCKGVNWKTEFMKFMSAYEDDMPNFRTIHAELDLWETSWKNGFEKVEYDNIADTLRNFNELAFPNIYVALKILAVVPVTTCECEHSVSALRCMKYDEDLAKNHVRCMKNWLRTQCVKLINGIRSEWKTTNGGIPQGTRLGPILFNELAKKWGNRIKFVDLTVAEIIPRN